jgi:hypothetical protein
VWLHYFACVLATRSYVWLQNLTVFVWLKSYFVIWYMIASLGSVWLQKKTVGSFVIAKPILCVTLQTQMVIFYGLKKNKNGTSVWLQLFCVRDFNKKLSVVANFDCICVVEIYLVIWYMIASLCSVWLRKQQDFCDCKKLFCVCHCKHYWLFYDCKKWLNRCVLFCVRDCNQKLSVVAKSDCVCVVEKLLGYLVYDYKPG